MNEPASSQSHQTPTSRTRIIIAFLIAVFPAFAWSIFFGDIAPQDDAGEYWKLGVQWAETGVYGTKDVPEAYWPPGYPAFIMAAVKVVGAHWRAVAALNLLLHLGTIGLIGWVAMRTFGARTAEAAMVLAGWIWDIATLPAVLLSENTFNFILIAGVALMMVRTKGWARAACFFAAGVLWGVGALTRGNILGLPFFLIVAVAIWIPWAFRMRLRVIALLCVLLAGYLVPIGIWAQRNYRAYHMFIPISLNSGEILALSFNPDNTWWYLAPGDPKRANWGLVEGDYVGNYKRGRDTAIAEIKGHPIRSFFKSLPKVWWTFNGQLPWFANRDIAKVWANEYYIFESAITWQWTIFMLLVLGGALFARHLDTPQKLLLLGVVAYWVFFHGVVKVVPRYRIPIIPIFAIYAGFFFAQVLPRIRTMREIAARPITDALAEPAESK
jgi:4-amino-4-deoxy-L-arabinose transferase-like glycosyltransferase